MFYRLLAIVSLTLLACSEDPVSSESPPQGHASLDTSLDVSEETLQGDVIDLEGPDTSDDVVEEDTNQSGSGAPAMGTRFAWDAGSERFVLTHDGVVRLSVAPSDLELGVVPEVDESLNYDPYYLEEGDDLAHLYTPPEGLMWRQVVGVLEAESEGEEARFRLSLDQGGEAGLAVTHPGEGRVRLHWTPPSAGEPVVFFRLSPRIDPDEGLYGLGEVFDHVNHRGRVRAMQIELAELQSGYNEVHAPIPLLTGTTGWGLFVESMRPGVFACATEAPDTVRVTFGTREDSAQGLVVHLFSADHPLDIVGRYYDVTGRPGPIGEWAMGPWIWRDEVSGQAAVEEDLATIRALDLPTTGYWIDRPYASAVNSFDFKPSDYPDPVGMMQVASDLGFAMALWHTPYTDPNDPATEALFAEAEAEGYFAPLNTTGLAKWGPPLDFTNPQATAWWQSLLGAYASLGIVGYKLDYAEEVVVGALGARFPWTFHDGSNELTMHRGYQLGYHAAYADLLPESGGFLLCRAATYGDQTLGTIMWPGDIDATLTRHGEVVTTDEGSYVSVGGLHAAVVAGSSLGPSGLPFFGSDTGGYRNAPPNEETYIRWFQHTALSPIMQVGTNTNDLPWSFGPDKTLDEDLVALYRRYARLHLRLHPYLWTYVARLQSDGRAIQRPLGLAHPELGWHGDDIYLLGDHLLVAPVTSAGVTSRDIPLPAGEWVDWWTGERVQGGESVTRPAPLDTIPVLIQAGALVPLLSPEIDTLLPVSAPSSEIVISTADAPGPLFVRGTPGPESLFTLYDGTTLRQLPTEGGFRLEASFGERFTETIVFEIIGLQSTPTEVEASQWAFDEALSGRLTLTLSPSEPSVDVRL